MTETANEALIRNAYAAFALGEIDKLLDLVDPNLEWTYLDPGLPDPAPQTCHGRGELAAALSRQAESGLSSRLEEVRASGDQVLVVSHTPGIDAYRVTPADDRNYDVFSVRQGRVVAIQAYRDELTPLLQWGSRRPRYGHWSRVI
jgi:ketosteroid isomerase-like protein